MPGRDRSGPMGMGARAGRGFGVCAGNNRVADGKGPQTGSFGMGLGGGGGRAGVGTRNPGRFRFPFLSCFSRLGRWGAPFGQPDPSVEKQILEQEVNALQRQLKAVQDRLSAMEQLDSD